MSNSEDKKAEFGKELEEWTREESTIQSLEEENRANRIKKENERNKFMTQGLKSLDALDPVSLFTQKYNGEEDLALDIEAREDALLNRPFIDSKFQEYCKVARHQLYVFVAAQKQGKSTFAANIAWGLYKEKRKVLFITNEELKKDVLGRIACIDLGINYNNHIFGKTTAEESEKIHEQRKVVAEYVHVISEAEADTKDADVVEKLIRAAPGQDYEIILLDYITKIHKATKASYTSDWQAQEPLWYFLDSAKKIKGMPCITVFAQCLPKSSKNPAPLKERIEGRKLATNFGTGIFEIVKDKKNGTTIIDIHATRWYTGTDEHIFRFNKGKLESMDYDQYIQHLVDQED